MILDNQSGQKKVHQWITDYTRAGAIDAVTGYFTVAALAYLSDQINDRITRFRFIIGDIVKDELAEERPLDLLNETLTIDGALHLKSTALCAVEFLRQKKVQTKTLEPNFCHATFWVFNGKDAPASYFISGSSNLTAAGLGLKQTHNIELNTVGQGTQSDHNELKDWFADLWERPEASFKKTVNGRKIDFKQYLIDEISRIFVEYTPRQLYYKTLFEMFGRPLMEFQEDPTISRNMGRLEHSEIYKALYEFQRKGVISLIKMLQTYGGAILADAVGLGKTWSALAVMKYYQSLGYDIILLCPKKLDHNWRKFQKHHDSRFEKDEFDYVIRYHTDLQDDRLERHPDGIKLEFFQRKRPKLLVIDESHHLRNSKSNRYKFLVDQILRPNEEVKVLLLSATPINNTLIDVRNQFKLLVKRLESSWRSFQTTLEKVLAHHQNALAKVKQYKAGQTRETLDTTFSDVLDLDEDWEQEELTLGKRAIPIADIAAAHKLDQFKNHLESDIRCLEVLAGSLAFFEKQMNAEKRNGKRDGSRDEKLARLMKLIREKRKAGHNRGNKKVLIFTAYTDTADYLYEHLLERGFKRVAVVTGTESRVWDSEHSHKDFEPILERFVPCTKLFGEREWPQFHPSDPEDIRGGFEEWKEWIDDNHPRTAKKLAHPVDILIATDCLSEGQNLQDCDFVVNYDIHWNPVRAIQRMGRIDRLGSINDCVFAANFWPTKEIDGYLRLQQRIEDKMAQMRLVGSEIRDDFTERIKQILDDEHIQQSQEAKLLKQLQGTWDDIETGDQEFGFDKLSLENFRQDLLGELSEDEKQYDYMPNGVFTGFVSQKQTCPKDGIIALLGYPARKPGDTKRMYDAYDLIYVDREGNDVLLNPKDVLEALAQHKDQPRTVPKGLDQGDPLELNVWAGALKNWLHAQTVSETADENGKTKKVAGAATMDLIAEIQQGNRPGTGTLKRGKTYDDRFKEHNVDLILWFALTNLPQMQQS